MTSPVDAAHLQTRRLSTTIGPFAALVLMLIQAGAGEPLGVATVPTRDERLTAIWHDLQLDIASDEFRIARCRVERKTSGQ